MSKYQEELWKKREDIGANQYVPLFTAMRIIAELEKRLEEAHDTGCREQIYDLLTRSRPTPEIQHSAQEDALHGLLKTMSRQTRD